MSLARPFSFDRQISAKGDCDAVSANAARPRDYPFDGIADSTILSGLAQEGLRLSASDEIAILEWNRRVALIRITLHKAWPFGKPRIFYGVTHDGLPFPILFRRISEASAFFARETEKAPRA